jgi:hypothetical protein
MMKLIAHSSQLIAKYLFLSAISFLAMSSPCFAQGGMMPGPGVKGYAAADECAGYLVCQNFEGTGYDHSETWTETADGTVDEDYTTTVLRGSQSLYINDSTGTNETNIQFGTTNPVYYFFRYRPVSHSGNDQIMRMTTTAASASGNLLHLDSAPSYPLRAYHGTITADGTVSLAAGTTYYIWGKYQAASGGSNGIHQVWIGTSGLKSEATLDIDMSTGDDTDQAGRIYLNNNGVGEGIYDQVLVKSTEIGDAPL